MIDIVEDRARRPYTGKKTQGGAGKQASKHVSKQDKLRQHADSMEHEERDESGGTMYGRRHC